MKAAPLFTGFLLDCSSVNLLDFICKDSLFSLEKRMLRVILAMCINA